MIDALTMKKKLSTSLPQVEDLVCLTHNEENLYAIGSKSHIQFVDSRTLKPVSTIGSKDPSCGIRSLSFNSKILTVGTGIGKASRSASLIITNRNLSIIYVGNILFYDIRNSKYFNNLINQNLVVLKTSRGWMSSQEQNQYGHFTQMNLPAIYTHQYDSTRTQLLAAGGPLASQYVGNYCGLWSI